MTEPVFPINWNCRFYRNDQDELALMVTFDLDGKRIVLGIKGEDLERFYRILKENIEGKTGGYVQ